MARRDGAGRLRAANAQSAPTDSHQVTLPAEFCPRIVPDRRNADRGAGEAGSPSAEIRHLQGTSPSQRAELEPDTFCMSIRRHRQQKGVDLQGFPSG
jgi:hypothetical protein